MLVGPSCIGKSTIMNEVVRLDERFSRVRSFTTRSPRTNDEPGHYFYLTADELEVKQANGEVISSVMFPTSGQTYGTLTSSYTSEYCLLDTLANSVEVYRNLPFANTIAVSVTTSAELWQKRFTGRYPKPSDEATKRLEEARLSINWSLNDTKTLWLVNRDSPKESATNLLQIIESGTATRDAAANVHAMLELIDRGMWT